MKMRGRFITLEGIDGAGKSTHHLWLIDRLREVGKTVVATREPGGTVLGEKLRGLLLHESMHLETEALLMFAARREHIDKVIEPALQRGDWVVSDRFTDASFAYQGGGRGLSAAKLEALELWVQGGLQPDRTFLFDIEPSLARQRLAQSANEPDRFEREQEEFFTRVRAAYLQRAVAHASRFAVIDASQSLDAIKVILEQYIISDCI
jgi:dTMP kinase